MMMMMMTQMMIVGYSDTPTHSESGIFVSFFKWAAAARGPRIFVALKGTNQLRKGPTNQIKTKQTRKNPTAVLQLRKISRGEAVSEREELGK